MGELEQLAKLIEKGKSKRILVLTGAGVSTGAGIPDFRSPGTGLYDNLQKYDLPYPEAIFEVNYYRKRPAAFVSLAPRALARDQVQAHPDAPLPPAAGRQGIAPPHLFPEHRWAGIPGRDPRRQARGMPRALSDGLLHRLREVRERGNRQGNHRERRENTEVRPLRGERQAGHCLFRGGPPGSLPPAPETGHPEGGFAAGDGYLPERGTGVDDPGDGSVQPGSLQQGQGDENPEGRDMFIPGDCDANAKELIDLLGWTVNENPTPTKAKEDSATTQNNDDNNNEENLEKLFASIDIKDDDDKKNQKPK
eukprot:CAMPEP_0201194634 /NCGR_PEP_ID=MMETSP0851-20130426/149517_1 /ASSEMBLY_ACC=CAM_ASM_000631 /TAXON_ID=183588 /ORGANISM="Pseudo-nitzschia fraudulenta, Strain WWA7" /LENGTH=307 /DNA_ID=CAMNT_0047481335 /DNA_START=52 /DNA_END=975 /DNA_ORIENTATION=+